MFRRLIVNQLYGDKMKANVTSLEQNPSEMAGFNLEEDVYNETCKILSGTCSMTAVRKNHTIVFDWR